MFIRSNGKNQNEEASLALKNEEEWLRYDYFDDKNWTAILCLIEAMATTIVNNFSDKTQHEIGLFMEWSKGKAESSRHVPHKESIGLYACLMFLQPYVSGYSTYLARDIGFLMQVIEDSKDGIHYVLNLNELGDAKKVMGMTQMEFYCPDRQKTDA